MPNTCAEPISAYQVAAGVVACVLGLVCFVFDRIGMKDYHNEEQIRQILGFFSTAWWAAIFIVCTFFGSFKTVQFGNGYFACWIGLGTSGIAHFRHSKLAEYKPKTSKTALPALVAIFWCSGVVMGAGIQVYQHVSFGAIAPSNTGYNPYSGFAIALGVVSMAFSLSLIIFSEHLESAMMRLASIFFIIWWLIGTMVLTFGNVFQIAYGNGYFGSYLALGFSVWLFAHGKKEVVLH